ncbi:MAG: hypothetical protein L0154_26530 [Chloroflexi bacterium]|nr:hypothetical protein [Chloroflexota bacterium]
MFRQILVILLTAMLVTACQDDDKTSIAAASLSLTATATVSATHTVTPSPTTSPTVTATLTATSSTTPTPSVTPTLAEPVLVVTAVMDGVRLYQDRASDSTHSTIPPPVQILPDATSASPATYGWKTYESDHPAIVYEGAWTKISSRQASRGQYHYCVEPGSLIRFSFEGSAVRLRYVAFSNGGQWQLWIDGQLVTEFDNYSASADFGMTEIFTFADGPHTLEVRMLETTNPSSTDYMVALDAIDVYQPVPQTPQPTTPTTTPQPAAHIELLQGAPTIQPTTTAEPPIVVNASVVIAYDENANRVIDLAEGVQGLPVRMVEVGTNRVLTQAFTDSAGFATLEAVTNQSVRLVVPYLGAYWDVRVTNQLQSFSLLLPPGHQPGLIP